MRALLANVLPHRGRFRLALGGAMLARPFAGLFEAVAALKPLAAMLKPRAGPPATRSAGEGERRFPPVGPRRARVAMLDGCAQPVLRPEIDEAAIRLLDPHGCRGACARKAAACCGSLTHHMGKEDHALANARANVDAWSREIEGEGLDAIIITTSGCGTTIKDYGHMLRLDPAYAERAARVSALAKDISEFLAERGAAGAGDRGRAPRRLSRRLLAPARPEGAHRAEGVAERSGLHRAGAGGRPSVLRLGRHLQHPAAGDRRAAARAQGRAISSAPSREIVATGNIGCMTQIGGGTSIPVLHTVELLDWATGGRGRGCSTACASPPDRSAAARL